MTQLPTLLWKEWRDHRAPLIAFPIAIAPLIALGVALLPPGQAKNAALPTFVVFGAFTIAVLTLLADLVPSEEQRGTIALLRRMPGGLAPVFTAKLLFGLLATVAFCAAGYFWTTIASAALRGGPWFPTIEVGRTSWMRNSASYRGPVEWWPLLLVVAVWILPVSTWLPRGALALPAAAFLLVLIVAPVLPAFFTHPGLAPTRDDLVAAWLALLIGAPLIAGLSFVLGRRRGGGLGASAWRGLLLTLLLATPGWSRVGSYVSRWDHLDPNDASFRIGASARSLVGSSGRYAFLTTHHQFDSDGPSHAIAVDLTDGSWQELGRAGDEFWPVGNYRNTSAVPFVARFGASDTLGRHFSTYAEADAALERWIVLDADTLATKAVAHQRDLPDPFRASEEASRCERIANALWLPGGQRVWMQDRQLVTDATDGGVRVLNESKMTRSSWALPIGHGMRLFGTNGVVVYDALREQRFEIPNSVTVHFVRPGRWLVSRDLDPQHHRETCLYDPESGAFTPLPQPIAKCEFPIFLDDGRCLAIARDPDAIREAAARHGTSPPGSLSVVDLDTGARESIALPPWFEGGLQYAELEGRTPAGALVIKLAPSRSGAGWCHARVDLAAHRMVAAGDANQYCNELLGCTDESTLYVVAGEQRLLRGHFGSAAFELVFPKAAR